MNKNITGNNHEAQQGNESQINNKESFALLDEDIAYEALTRALRKFPEATRVAKIELARKAIEDREEKRLKVLGDDCTASQEMKELDSKYRRPRWVQLRNSEGCHCIARKKMDGGGICEAFSNGYAIYFNGNRHAILWIPEFAGEGYIYFHPLSEKERRYLTEKEGVSGDVLGNEPWYLTIMLRGEDRIEFRMQHPKSGGEMRTEEEQLEYEAEQHRRKNNRGFSPSRFPNPEEAYLQKEEEEEQLALMGVNEHHAFVLYHKSGFNQDEIAKILGVSQKSVSRYLQRAKEIIREYKRQDGFDY